MKRLQIKERVAERTFRNRSIAKSDPAKYLAFHYKKLRHVLARCFVQHGSVKYQIHFQVRLVKHVPGNEKPMICEPWFLSDMTNVIGPNYIASRLKGNFDEILARFDRYLTMGSGWTLDRILNLKLIVVKIVKVLSGGDAFENHDSLPLILKHKKAVINLKSPSGECFIYSVAACLKRDRSKNPSRCSQYKSIVEKLVEHEPWMSFDKLATFEKSNKLKLYVYGWDSKKSKSTILYFSERKQGPKCSILYHKRHYYPITSLSRLLCQPGSHNRVYMCSRCQVTYTKLSSLGRHNKICMAKNHQVFCAPEAGTHIKFTNYSHLFKKNFVVYTDFECMAVPLHENKGKKTELIEKHVPVSFAALRKCDNPKFDKGPIIEHGENILKRFWQFLDEEYSEMERITTEFNYPIDMTNQDQKRYDNTTKCDICQTTFSRKNKKTKDHNHLLKKCNFRFVACNRCNLTYGATKLAPVVIIHNLQSYDSHLLISQLQHARNVSQVSVVPKNTEKYLSFKIGNWTFIDSLAFLPASLQTLTDSLKEEGISYFRQTQKFAGTPEKLTYLLRKNPYPYTYAKSLDDYNLSGLPRKQEFNNKLKDEFITDAEYSYAQTVYRKFRCKSFLDYHKLYLAVDVTLLADVFERYRCMVIDHYQVDAAHYLSSPQLAMDGFLRTTGVSLECISDMTQIRMLESSVRGGISVIGRKFARANNKLMGDLYDETKPTSYICLFDCVNLYAAALRQKLPYRKFKWLEKDKFTKLDFSTINTKGKTGYILEVDLEYPQNIHRDTQDYPLAAEKIVVKNSYLSPHSQQLKQELRLPKHSKVEKLVPNLWDKKHYVVHFSNLKYYLKRGMKLVKIHRVLSFEQRAWLAPFIDSNTARRQQAKTKFQQLYFKQQNNSIFGKLLEQKRKRIDLKLVANQSYFDQLVAQPNFTGIKVFNQNVAAVSMQKPKVILDRPLAAGFTTLELSKLIMQKFFRLITQKLYRPHQVDLLLTDTDSLLFHLKVPDIYHDLQKIKQYLDTSNYPSDHPLFSVQNKMRPGCFRDETPPSTDYGVPCEFVGLKSKMYSIRYTSDYITKKAKGINKAAMKSVSHDMYLTCLREHSSPVTSVHSIRSFGHQLYTVQVSKSSLNAFDDKRYFLRDNYSSWPYGYHKIPLEQRQRDWELKPLETHAAAVESHTTHSVLEADSTMENKTYRLGDFKKITVSYHQGYVYYHVNDTKKNKRITFNSDEFKKITARGKKLINIGNKILLSHKNKKKADLVSLSSDEEDDDGDESNDDSIKTKKRKIRESEEEL